MFNLLVIAVGGALGSICRFAVSKFVQDYSGSGFSWGTTTVNVIGCFVIGLLWSLSNEKDFLSPASRFFFMIGFLGAFTTFSTYALETINFYRENELLFMAANILLNNLIGFIMIIMGIWVGRLL